MFTFFIFVLLTLLVAVAVFYLVYLVEMKWFNKDGGTLDFLDFFTSLYKMFFIIWLGCAIVTFSVAYKPIMNSLNCGYKAYVMNADTKYSWLYGECYVKTGTGSWVAIDKQRATPEGVED